MCSYPHCMQLYGGCGVGCTAALAARSRKRLKPPVPIEPLPTNPDAARLIALLDELRRQIIAAF